MTESEILSGLHSILNDDFDIVCERLEYLILAIENDMGINVIEDFEMTAPIKLGTIDCICYGTNTLAPLTCTAPAVNYPKQEGNNPMCYNNSKTYDDTQFGRNYLKNRVYDIQASLEAALRKQFFIYVEEPKNAKELIARITAGEYTLDEKKSGQFHWGHGMLYGIDWRTKDQVEDVEGFRKAQKALDEEVQNVLDKVAILDPRQALDEVDAFKKWTYTA